MKTGHSSNSPNTAPASRAVRGAPLTTVKRSRPRLFRLRGSSRAKAIGARHAKAQRPASGRKKFTAATAASRTARPAARPKARRSSGSLSASSAASQYPLSRRAAGSPNRMSRPSSWFMTASPAGDRLEPAAITRADDGRSELEFDRGARGGAQLPGQGGVLEQLLHPPRGVVDVRRRPGLALGVGTVVAVEGDKVAAHGAGIALAREIRRAGPVRGDHRFAEVHALGDREAEAFRAVQRDEAVAGGLELVDFRAREGLR